VLALVYKEGFTELIGETGERVDEEPVEKYLLLPL
jgi:hypothetical protein